MRVVGVTRLLVRRSPTMFKSLTVCVISPIERYCVVFE